MIRRGRMNPRTPQENPPTAPSPPEENANSQFPLMQLKLIRGMQQELNDRTARLDQDARDTNGWNADRVRRAARTHEPARSAGRTAGAVAERRCARGSCRGRPAVSGPLEELERALDRDAKPTPRPCADWREHDRSGTSGRLARRTAACRRLQPLPAASSLQQPGAAAASLQTAGSDVQPEHPLQRIGQRMREVEQRLAQRDLAEPTQAEQRQIVAELETLIDDLASRQQQQQSQQRARVARGRDRTRRTNRARKRPRTAQIARRKAIRRATAQERCSGWSAISGDICRNVIAAKCRMPEPWSSCRSIAR